jgi:hypothetical protein
MSAAVAFLCLAMAAFALREPALPELALSVATVLLVSAVCLIAVLRSRSTCREASP